MKIQVASNTTVNRDLLDKIVQERRPNEAPNVTEAAVEQSKEAVKIAKRDESSMETMEEIQRQVDQTNDLFEVNYTSVKFQVHEDTERLMIHVVDKKTQEVLREIPSEEFLDMVSRMVDYMGFMIDEKV